MRAATAAKSGGAAPAQRRTSLTDSAAAKKNLPPSGHAKKNNKGAPADASSASSPLPVEAPVSLGAKSPYLARVAQRSEEVIERRMLAELEQMEQRRRLGLEPTTRKMLDPLAVNPNEELAASLERGKKDIVVSIPTKNEVRVYRRARTDVKAVLRSLDSVQMDLELFDEASKRGTVAIKHLSSGGGSPSHNNANSNANTSSAAVSPTNAESPDAAGAAQDSGQSQSGTAKNAIVIPRGLDPSFRSNVALPPTYAAKPCDLNQTLTLSGADLQGNVPREAFQLWITERQLIPPIDPNAGRGRRRRIRHHRRSCKYNLYSTNREFRQLSLQVTFPSKALRASAATLRHAVHGGSNGYTEETFDVNEFFVPMTPGWWAPEDTNANDTAEKSPNNMTMTNATSHHGSPLTSSMLRSTGRHPLVDSPFQPPAAATPIATATAAGNTSSPLARDGVVEDDLRSENTVAIEDLPVATMTFDHVGRGAEESNSALFASPATEPVFSFAYSSAPAFMTENNNTMPSRPQSRMAERCRTPDVSSLLRPNATRPHIERKKEYWDCDCTDRSTDDELDVVRDAFVDEAAACANARLECWRRGFAKAKVQTRARLASRLGERDDDRAAVCGTRRHFAPITHEAEVAGEEWRINRQARSSTPSGASMWHARYEGVCEDMAALTAARDAYVALCDECFKIQFPATDAEATLADLVRRRFIARYRDAVIITPAFVKEFLAAHAAQVMATKVAVRFLDVLRLQAKVPVAEFLQLITDVAAKLRKQAELKRVGAASHVSMYGGPISSEVDTLIRRLTKQIANMHGQASMAVAASIRRASENVPAPQ